MQRFDRSILVGAALAALMAAVGPGCSRVAEGVTDGCQAERASYDAAVRKLGGLRERGVDTQRPTYRAAEDELRRAQVALSSCGGVAAAP